MRHALPLSVLPASLMSSFVMSDDLSSFFIHPIPSTFILSYYVTIEALIVGHAILASLIGDIILNTPSCADDLPASASTFFSHYHSTESSVETREERISVYIRNKLTNPSSYLINIGTNDCSQDHCPVLYVRDAHLFY